MPRDVSKAHATKVVIETLRQQHGPDAIDFVFSIGDDRSDEDMFVYCNGLDFGGEGWAVTCTVGSKSSEAHWFVPGVSAALQNLQAMAEQGQ